MSQIKISELWYVSSLLHSTQQTIAKWCIHLMPEYSCPQKSCVDCNFTSRLQFSLISCNCKLSVWFVFWELVSCLIYTYGLSCTYPLRKPRCGWEDVKCWVLMGRGEEKQGGMRMSGLEEQGANISMCIGWVCLYFSRDFFNINVS